MNAPTLNIPIGQIEFLGQVLYIVQHDDRLVAACTDEEGLPYEALSSNGVDSGSFRSLMREAIDLLLDASELSLALAAFNAQASPPDHWCAPTPKRRRQSRPRERIALFKGDDVP